MKHVVAHPLDREDAKRALEGAWAEYGLRFPKHAPRLQWLSSDQARVGFHAMGLDIEGTVRVFDRGMELDLRVPWVLRAFVGPAQRAIEREVTRCAKTFQERSRGT